MESCDKEDKYMKIYTKAGDKGYTSNVKGEKLWKGSLWIELQGHVDLKTMPIFEHCFLKSLWC